MGWAWTAVAVLLLASSLHLVLSLPTERRTAASVPVTSGDPPPNITLPTTSTSTTTTTAPPPTTVRMTPPTTRPAPKRAAVPPAPGLTAFRGLGAWVDVFDWSEHYTNGNPPFVLADVDRMAALGTQTLFIQAARADVPDQAVLEPDRLGALIARAHSRGLRVVVWYLPSLEDVNADLGHLLAIARLPSEGLAVDIESTKVADPVERSRRLVTLTLALRQALPGRPIAATVLPPVVTDVINTNYWPGFPWRAIASSYDVWQVMDYWTFRTQSSGYRDAYRYTAENLDRLKADLGGIPVAIDPVGGIGDKTTPADIDGFHRAAVERGAIGGSLYDYRTTGDGLWPGLRAFRA